MQETVIIYIQTNLLENLDIEDSHFVKWIKLDEEGVPITRGAEARLEQVSSVTQNANVIVLLPLEQILLTKVNTRARKQKHLQKAVPFALEDELADDIDNLHFALGQRFGENDYPVAVIDKGTLDRIIDELSDVGIYPDLLTADLFGLPFREGTWTILVEDERALVRTEFYQGFTIDLHNIQQVLSTSLRQAEVTPGEINVYCCDEQQQGIKKLELPISVNNLDDCPPGLFADGLDENECINLLQTSYKNKDKKHRQFGAWKIAAMLFAAWLALSFVSVFLDHSRLNKQEKKLDQQIVQITRQTFPDMQNVSADSARTKMEARLKNFIDTTSASSNASFMELLAQSGESMKKAGQVEINTMSFRAGKLDMNVRSSDVQVLETVKQTLKSQSYTADIQSANTQGDSVEAKIIIAKGDQQ